MPQHRENKPSLFYLFILVKCWCNGFVIRKLKSDSNSLSYALDFLQNFIALKHITLTVTSDLWLMLGLTIASTVAIECVIFLFCWWELGVGRYTVISLIVIKTVKIN